MQCLFCNVDMTQEDYEGVHIDACPSCNGIWLDERELNQIVKRREEVIDPKVVKEVHSQGKKSGVSEQEQDRVVQCLKCKTKMIPANFSYTSGIIIDKCPRGCGIWLDEGELDHIQAFAEKWEDYLAKNRQMFENMAGNVKAKTAFKMKQSMPKRRFGRGRLIAGLLGGIFDLD